MEFVAQAQALLAENAMYVGIGLLLTLILAGFLWYSMSRGSSPSSSKGVLENQARMNMATTDVPSAANQTDPVMPPQMSQEDLEKQIANIGKMDSVNSAPE
jgi:hypothetical protein